MWHRSTRSNQPGIATTLAALLAAALVAGTLPGNARGQEGELITVSGRVIEAGESRLVIVDRNERTLTYQVVPGTRIALSGRSVPLVDLRAGDMIQVVTSPAEPRVALRLVAEPPPAPAAVVEEPAPAAAEIHGTLGVFVGPSPTGVLVVDVQEGSPADKVGLDAGSFILSVNGVEVGTPQQLLSALEQFPPGETVKFSVWTGGETRDMAIVLASSRDFMDGLPRRLAAQAPPPLEIPAVLDGLTLKEAELGVQVVDVEPRSPADQLGVRPGDIVQSIGGVRVSTTAELYRIVDSLAPGAKAQIAVQRGERDVELVLAIPVARQVTTRRPAAIEAPADMPEYARILNQRAASRAASPFPPPSFTVGLLHPRLPAGFHRRFRCVPFSSPSSVPFPVGPIESFSRRISILIHEVRQIRGGLL